MSERETRLQAIALRLLQEPSQIGIPFMDGPNLDERLIDEWVCQHCGHHGDAADMIEHADDCDYVAIKAALWPSADVAISDANRKERMMGLYDDIIGECPYCKAEYYAQTKLGDCGMREWRVGSKTDLPDGRIVLKNECECGNQPVAVVVGGILTALVKRGPGRKGDIEEGYFGSMTVRP